MSKESCITHQTDYHVKIRRDYVDLFDGDHCAAVVLSILEFATDGETRRMRLAEETGSDPWVKASVSSIFQDCMGLYSERSIADRLGWLKDAGFMTVSSAGLGKVNRYLVNGDSVSGHLSMRKVLRRSDCKIADEETAPSASPSASPYASPSAKTTPLYKEEELRTENIDKESSPTASFDASDLNLEDDIAEFLANSSRRMRGPKIKLNRRQDERIIGKLHGFEQSLGRTEFRSAWLRYVAWWLDNGKEVNDAMAYFLGSVPRWAEDSNAPGQKHTATTDPDPVLAVSISTRWRSDESYGRYLFALAEKGRRITEDEAEKAYPLWCQLTSEQRESSIVDAKYVAAAASEPKYIPGPAKHLASKPWTAIRIEVPKASTKQERAMIFLLERQAARERGEFVL